ncbi:hypothetical protein TNCV_164711 [Trichonephila clavipes]|nr:hypothetical protein TNCV_164711 [Trichonephila clavipes]
MLSFRTRKYRVIRNSFQAFNKLPNVFTLIGTAHTLSSFTATNSLDDKVGQYNNIETIFKLQLVFYAVVFCSFPEEPFRVKSIQHSSYLTFVKILQKTFRLSSRLKMPLQSKTGQRTFTTTPLPTFSILRTSTDSAKESSVELKEASSSSEEIPTLTQEK